MLAQPFDRLRIARQYRNPPKPVIVKPIGYDTETVNGLARLITNSENEYTHPESFLDCLKFLCRKSTRGKTGFWYNMRYDFQAILKWLPPDLWKVLYDVGEIETAFDHSKGTWKISYLPSKTFSITHRTSKPRTWKFYDISQYFGKGKLDDIASSI